MPARRRAIQCLAYGDCHWWPEVEKALIIALRTDRNECVSLEAAIGLGKGAIGLRSHEFTKDEQIQLASRVFLTLPTYHFMVGGSRIEGMLRDYPEIAIVFGLLV